MKTTDTHVYFYGGIFSNWHVCSFRDSHTKLSFDTTERAFMWYKAVTFNDANTMVLLETDMHPSSAKKLGRSVKNFDAARWNRDAMSIMIYVNQLKFSQNSAFKDALLATGNRILVEASPNDTVWGVGLGVEDPLILDEKNWKGTNWLGKALMEVRRKLAMEVTPELPTEDTAKV